MDEAFNASAVTATRTYSPLTLSNDWSKIGRLLFMVCSATVGSIMNGFFVAAFFVERSLRKAGNVYLACAGLVDLIITTGLIPSCAVVLLSGQWDLEPVCYALHFLAEAGTYAYSVFFMFVALENFCRICLTSKQYAVFISMKVGIVAVLIYVICFAVAGVGVYLRYDYDYCTRSYSGNLYYRISTGVALHVLPFIVTMSCLITSSICVRRKARRQIQYRRSQVYESDSSSTTLNITAYLFYVLAWTPYVIILLKYPNTSDSNFYQCAWLGLYRSVLTSFFYACLNRNYRRAFAHLFNYCCCKNTLSSSLNSRQRRTLDYKSTSVDIKVHIMHHFMTSVNSPTRCGSSSRETQEL